jgi:betaine-aldehyde dehydrogenase
VIERSELYIDGAWVGPSTGDVLTVDEAATTDIIGTVPAGDASDAERAVLAARRSFDAWAQVPMAERADAVTAIAAGLRAREAELAEIMALTSQKAPRPSDSPKYRETFAISAAMEKWRNDQ